MNKKRISIALATVLLMAGASAASAAIPQPSGANVSPPASTTPHWNSGQRLTYFNKQGKPAAAPTYFAPNVGDAALGR